MFVLKQLQWQKQSSFKVNTELLKSLLNEMFLLKVTQPSKPSHQPITKLNSCCFPFLLKIVAWVFPVWNLDTYKTRQKEKVKNASKIQ